MKQQEESKNPVIYVDNRETKSGIMKDLADFGALPEPNQLKVGDYVCSDRVCIERKTVSDFLQSMFNNRLFEQLNGLVNSFEKPVMIIEGNQELLFSGRGVHANAVRGILSAIAIDFRIPIIWTRNTRETAAQVFWIAKREQFPEKREICVRASKKIRSPAQQQEFLVAGLPNVNSKLSKRLLRQFKTAKRVFSAKEEMLMKVEGIGKEKARRIFETLNSEYNDGEEAGG